MTRDLLDTNALIALMDPDQEFHESTARWFFADPRRTWLTCPITENGAVRILSLAQYPRPVSVSEAYAALVSLTGFGRHEHVPDDVSLLEPELDPTRISSSGQITDSYLLALARHHDARLATLDRRMSTDGIRGEVDVFQIPS